MKRSRFGEEVGKVGKEGVNSWVNVGWARRGRWGYGLEVEKGVNSMSGNKTFELV
jgi:hypothetical protein